MKKYRDFANVLICGPADHEAAVTQELDKVWDTWTGWAVLTGIIESGKTVRIVPYSTADREKIGPVNAFAKATSVTAAGPRGAALFAGADDDPRTPTDERFTPSGRTGTGAGSDCEVHFTPGVFPTPVPACGTPIVWPCALPWYAQNRYADDYLCHELVHALRDVLGQLDLLPTRTRGYDNQEEFFAVLVQNVFASEKGMTVFRRDHSGGARKGADATAACLSGRRTAAGPGFSGAAFISRPTRVRPMPDAPLGFDPRRIFAAIVGARAAGARPEDYRRYLAQQFGVTDKQLEKIEQEGEANGWAPPRFRRSDESG